MAKTGRPKAKIDLEQVKTLYQIQCTDAEVAAVLAVDLATLMRRKASSTKFREMTERAKEFGKASLRRAQYKMAMDGNVTAQIWLGKNILGQRDDAYLHHVGADDGPIRIDQRAIIARVGDPRCWEQLAEAADALCGREDFTGGPGVAGDLRTEPALAVLPALTDTQLGVAAGIAGGLQKANGVHAPATREEFPGEPILSGVPPRQKP